MLRTFPLLLIAGFLVAPHTAIAHDRMPMSLIRLPESVSDLFIAETSTAKFHHFIHSGNSISYRGSHYMSIGHGGEGKERVGDRRTPLGVYFVTEELSTFRIHEKYGVKAFPLDYPNAWDLSLQRTGDGIWVHGVDPLGGKRPIRDTDGCIALPNEDLLELAAEFRGNVTPVLIMREVQWAESAGNDTLRNELEGVVADWATSLAEGDMYVYLSLYDDDFRRWGMSAKEWSSFSLQTVGRWAITAVVVSDLLLLAYPGEDGLYLSRFRQAVVEAGRETVSTKRLYWRRNTSGALKIIAEDNG